MLFRSALKNTPFADVTKTYSYKAIYDPSQRTGSVPDEYKVAGTYPFTLGEKATDGSYTQSGKWKSEYDALYGTCIGTTSSGANSLLNVIPDMHFSHFFTAIELDFTGVKEGTIVTTYKMECNEGDAGALPPTYANGRVQDWTKDWTGLTHDVDVVCEKTEDKESVNTWYEVDKIDKIVLTFPTPVVGEMNLDVLGETATSTSSDNGKVITINNPADLNAVRAFFASFTLKENQEIDVKITAQFTKKEQTTVTTSVYSGKRVETWIRTYNDDYGYDDWAFDSTTVAIYDSTPTSEKTVAGNFDSERPKEITLNLKVKTNDGDRTFEAGKLYTIPITSEDVEKFESKAYGYLTVTVGLVTELTTLQSWKSQIGRAHV